MKHCPVCNTNFTDDALGYCIEDGTVLQPGPAPNSMEAQETRILSDPAATAVISSPNPTDYGLAAANPGRPPQAEPYRWANETPQVWTAPPPPAAYPMRQQPQQTVAILALVFGLAGITFGWICGGFFLGVLAVILGLVALSQVKKNPTRYGGKPLAIGGIATGGIVLLVHLALFAIWIVMLVINSASR